MNHEHFRFVSSDSDARKGVCERSAIAHRVNQFFVAVFFSVFVLSTPCQAQNFQLQLSQFDSWIFDGSLGTRSRDEAEVMLEKITVARVDKLSEVVGLNERQAEKLRWAGRTEVEAFMRRVDAARRKFLEMDWSGRQQDVQEAFQMATPLRNEMRADRFGEDSLFGKTLSNILGGQQLDQWLEIKRVRHEAERDVLVKGHVARAATNAAMTARQREQYLQFVRRTVAKIQLHHQYGSSQVSYAVHRASKDADLSFLDDRQRKRLVDDPNVQEIGAFLRQQGLLDE